MRCMYLTGMINHFIYMLIITFVRKFFFSLTTFKMRVFIPIWATDPFYIIYRKHMGLKKIVQPIEMYLFLRYDKLFFLCAHNTLCKRGFLMTFKMSFFQPNFSYGPFSMTFKNSKNHVILDRKYLPNSCLYFLVFLASK